MSRKKVVVAGGGMAGSLAAHLLENDADVVLIDSKEYFELRWASLRALVEPRVADRIIIPHLEYLRRGKVVVGALKATTEREVVLEDGTVHPFDFLIIATGSKPEPSIAFQDRVWYFHKGKWELGHLDPFERPLITLPRARSSKLEARSPGESDEGSG